MSNPPVIDGNPTTYDVTLPGVQPGSFVVDMTGAVAGIASVQRTNPTTNTRVLMAPASSVGQPDAVKAVASSTGAGNRTLTFTVRDQAGVLRPLAPFEVALSCGETMQNVQATPSVGAIVGTGTQRIVKGRTDAVGVMVVSVEGTPLSGAPLTYFANSVSPTPGSLEGASTIP